MSWLHVKTMGIRIVCLIQTCVVAVDVAAFAGSVLSSLSVNSGSSLVANPALSAMKWPHRVF